MVDSSGRKDHEEYLDERFAEFAGAPGFPYLRMRPALLARNAKAAAPTAGEQLMFAMHGDGGRLSVVSNKRIRIFKIPEKRSMLMTTGAVALGFVPGVGLALTAFDGAKAVGNFFSGRFGGKGKEAAQRAANGMPAGEDLKLVWDLSDKEILGMVLSYKDQILLQNGFEWKVDWDASLQDKKGGPVEISLDTKGIRFKVGTKETFVQYPSETWNPLEIASRILLKKYRPALEAANWAIKETPEKLSVSRK